MKWPFWTRTQPVILDDCETIDPLLSLYADGMASPEEAQRVEAHLPGCNACRESLVWMQATQRALAARPVVRPPADLRARIAGAIAASSAAPIPASFSSRSTRTFALRPAYAAAASLAILGVIGYGWLHQQPAPTVRNPFTPPKQVAVLPNDNTPATSVKPILPGGIMKPHLMPHRHAAIKSTPSVNERTATNSVDEEPSASPIEVKTPIIAHSPVKPSPALYPTIRPHLPTVRKPIQLQPNSPLMANTKIPMPPVETHKAPVVQPENKQPEPVVAAVPKPTSPAIIEKQPIVTQDVPAKIASAETNSLSHSSNPLAIVNEYAAHHLHTAEFKATVSRSMGSSVAMTAAFNLESKSGTERIVGTDFH